MMCYRAVGFAGLLFLLGCQDEKESDHGISTQNTQLAAQRMGVEFAQLNELQWNSALCKRSLEIGKKENTNVSSVQFHIHDKHVWDSSKRGSTAIYVELTTDRTLTFALLPINMGQPEYCYSESVDCGWELKANLLNGSSKVIATQGPKVGTFQWVITDDNEQQALDFLASVESLTLIYHDSNFEFSNVGLTVPEALIEQLILLRQAADFSGYVKAANS